MNRLFLLLIIGFLVFSGCKKLFNLNSCLIASEETNAGEVRYTWEDNDKLVKVEIYNNGSLQQYADVVTDGRQVQTYNWYDATGQTVSQVEMYYDLNNRLEAVDFYSMGSFGFLELTSSYEFQHDGDDLIRYSYNKDGDLVLYHIFHRSSDKEVYQIDVMMPADTVWTSAQLFYTEEIKNPYYDKLDYTISFAPNSEFLATEVTTTNWNGKVIGTNKLTNHEVNDKGYPNFMTFEVNGTPSFQYYTYHNCD